MGKLSRIFLRQQPYAGDALSRLTQTTSSTSRHPIFPVDYIVGLLFIDFAKFDIYFSVDSNGLSADGLAVGNLIVAVVAIVPAMAITLLAHTIEPRK
jgi:hypothetical protein